MATSNYTNDDHPDIAYLLVFNYIFLQERVRLRIVCQRWKAIIEADCAQMTTLRVFGEADQIKKYISLTDYAIPLPSTEKPLKYDPNRWNTIILKRPGYDRVDIDFLARLFPAVQNLALTWQFGKQQKKVWWKKWKDYSLIIPKDVIEPDIFGLLTAWAPQIRTLFLMALSYKLLDNEDAFPDDAYLDAHRTNTFWSCLELMAPTLQNLSLHGVNLNGAPDSLILPHLEEISHYKIPAQSSTKQLGGQQPHRLITSPDQLQKLAPALQSFRQRNVGGLSVSPNIWKWQTPSIVSRIAFYIDQTPKHVLKRIKFTVCPHITHFEVHLSDSYFSPDTLPYLMRKFPNTKSLAIMEGTEVPRWFTGQGKKVDSVGFLSALARRPAKPLDSIEELHLGSISIDAFLCEYQEEEPDYDAMFRGIAVTFRGVKKLTLAIGPATEEKHREWHKEFIKLTGQYMPTAEVTFALEIDFSAKEVVFKDVFKMRPDYADPYAKKCFFSPGCAFVSQADESQVKEAINTNPNKKQRTN